LPLLAKLASRYVTSHGFDRDSDASGLCVDRFRMLGDLLKRD